MSTEIYATNVKYLYKTMNKGPEPTLFNQEKYSAGACIKFPVSSNNPLFKYNHYSSTYLHENLFKI